MKRLKKIRFKTKITLIILKIILFRKLAKLLVWFISFKIFTFHNEIIDTL